LACHLRRVTLKNCKPISIGAYVLVAGVVLDGLIVRGPCLVNAIPFFTQAIELDPNFAMADAYLGLVYDDLGEESKAVENFSKAFQLRDRGTESEKFLISSLYYFVVTGELEKTIQVSEVWTQAYPRDWRPRANLGSIYGTLGQYEKAVAETKKCLDIDPDNLTCRAFLIHYYSLMNRRASPFSSQFFSPRL
jgi:tetratricopeptide (TPR) repeat protein